MLRDAGLLDIAGAAVNLNAKRGDLDADAYAEGAETIMLALMLGMEQLRNDIEDRRRDAVSRFFADSLRTAT